MIRTVWICALLLCAAFVHAQSESALPAPPPTAEEAKLFIAERAASVMKFVRLQQFDSLAAYAHPEKGVRFAPYGFISATSNIRLLPKELAKAASDKRIFNWGRYDATDKRMRMSFKEYYKRFIYDRPFDSLARVSYQSIQRTNFVSNILSIYPQCLYADYLFEASEDFAEMDWKCLRLVFEEFDGKWYLVHIIHDEWTT